jgi:hypothetical protein
LRILDLKNWKKFALDRDEWAKLLKKGCRADDDNDNKYFCVTGYS